MALLWLKSEMKNKNTMAGKVDVLKVDKYSVVGGGPPTELLSTSR